MRLFSLIVLVLLLAASAVTAVYTGYYIYTGKKAWAVMYDDSLGQSLGPAESDLVLVEVIDYNCVHCRELKPVIERVQKAYPDLKIIVKHIPTNDEGSFLDARLALTAAKLGKFSAAHSFLLMRDEPLDDAALSALINELGVSEEEFINAAQSEDVASAMNSVFPAVGRLGIFSTPAFIFQGKIYTRFSRVPTFEDFVLLLSQSNQG